MLNSDKDVFIEKLRGLSIILVLSFHYTARIRYQDIGSDVPPLLQFNLGFIGVYLFFAISGYLIAKSLYACSALDDFYIKRFSRIWPLFLAANITVFVWTFFFAVPYVPNKYKFDVTGRTFSDLIATSFFLKDFGFKWIDGAYWSILVELKFYFLIGLFAYLFKNKFVLYFSYFSILVFSLKFIIGDVWFGDILQNLLISDYLPFFCLGLIAFEKKYSNKLLITLIILSACQVFDAIVQHGGVYKKDHSLMIFFFALGMFYLFDDLFFRGKLFLFFGKYSYSIYLFHQVIGLSIIMISVPFLGINLAIIFALLFVIAISVFFSELFEWRFRSNLIDLLKMLSKKVKLNNFTFVKS